MRHLLGGVRIVPTLDEAEALWRRNGVVATYVTPEGDVLAPNGWLRGGAGDTTAGVEHSLLGRKRELRELEAEVARLSEVMEAAQTETAHLEGEVGSLRARLPLLQRSIHAGEAERLAGEKDLEQTIRDQERVLRHRETVQAEARQVGLESDETTRTLTGLAQRMTAVREAETVQEHAMIGLRESIERAQDRDQALVADLTACRVELASATERVDALGRELTRLDQNETDLHERIATTRQRQSQLRERNAWLIDERERTDANARDIAVERDRVEEEARAAGQRHEGLLAELRAVETELRSVESDTSRLVNAIHGLELRATEGRVRREELVQEAWRAHGVDADALRRLHDPARDLEAARVRVGELEEKLTAIGAVNLVADDEYRELDERLTFLRTQHDDLTGSIKDLEKALRGMTRTAQERFAQAFDEVNRHFSNIFERLFEGGRAELRLVEAEEGGDPLDTGRGADGATPRQAAAGRLPDVGRRARPHGPGAPLRDLLLPAEPVLRARRSGRAARRREHPSLPPRAAGADQPDAVPGHHAQPQDDGSGGHPLWRDHGGAWALEARLSQSERGVTAGGGVKTPAGYVKLEAHPLCRR